MIGEQIGSYRVLDLLGSGGCGDVYRAEHELIGRQAAIKLLRQEGAGDADMVGRFFAEARTVNDVRHPNIVEITDCGYHEQCPYLVMELLEGDPLDRCLEQEGTLDLDMTVHVGTQVASALDAAHRHGIVHRDIKPANIFVTQHPALPYFVKVLDFGVAKLVDFGRANQMRTATGTVIGTPYYMSPEVCMARKDIDGRSDVYSLAVVLWELLVGHPPFEGAGMGALMMAHMNAPIPAARELNDQVSPAMDRVLMRALAKEPEGRQGSMAEFGADLEQALADPYGMPEVEAPVVTEPPEGDSSGLDLTDSPTEPAPVVAETAQLAGTQVEQAPVQVVDTAPPEPVDPDSGSELPFWMRPSVAPEGAGDSMPAVPEPPALPAGTIAESSNDQVPGVALPAAALPAAALPAAALPAAAPPAAAPPAAAPPAQAPREQQRFVGDGRRPLEASASLRESMSRLGGLGGEDDPMEAVQAPESPYGGLRRKPRREMSYQERRQEQATTARSSRVADKLETIIMRRVNSNKLNLPALPGNVLLCIDKLKAGRSNFDRVAGILARDPLLSAQVLRVANSPAFVAEESAHTLLEAVTRLGEKHLTTVLLDVSARRLFRSNNPHIRQALSGIWQHSVCVGSLARHIAELMGHDGDRSYLAGLMHDAGKPIVAGLLLDAERQLLKQDREFLDSDLWVRVVNRCHRQVGATIARKWKLADEEVAAIEHGGHFVEGEVYQPVNYVVFANAIAKRDGPYPGDVDQGANELLIERGAAMLNLSPLELDELSAACHAAA